MNCTACQQLLGQILDETDGADPSALEQHLLHCADCRAYHEATRRLQTGLKLLRLPAPPADLSTRVLDAIQLDRRRLRRRVRLRLALGVAVAASVVIAVALRLRPGQPTPTAPENGLVKDLVPEPNEPSPVVATVTPRRSMETAVEAMTSLTMRATHQTVEQTRKLIPLVEPSLPELTWEPALPSTLSLRDAGHGVSEGLEPVATHARRAIGLLRHDLLNQD